jgi:hypothetical protein
MSLQNAWTIGANLFQKVVSNRTNDVRQRAETMNVYCYQSAMGVLLLLGVFISCENNKKTHNAVDKNAPATFVVKHLPLKDELFWSAALSYRPGFASLSVSASIVVTLGLNPRVGERAGSG